MMFNRKNSCEILCCGSEGKWTITRSPVPVPWATNGWRYRLDHHIGHLSSSPWILWYATHIVPPNVGDKTCQPASANPGGHTPLEGRGQCRGTPEVQGNFLWMCPRFRSGKKYMCTCWVHLQKVEWCMVIGLRVGNYCDNFSLASKTLYAINMMTLSSERTATCLSLLWLFNPFTPESDQCQNSPAESQEIWHHTVWRTWLFIAYSD